MSNLKLGVEVVSAHNLMPKDGQGSASAFVELHFDNQKFRTTTKEKDLNPVWNESFYFNISDPNNLSNLNLEAWVYNLVKTTNSKSFLGKVRLTGTSFVPYSDAAVLHYPLEKRGILSRVKGELGLKVFLTDDPSIRSSNPLPAMESSVLTDSHRTQAQGPVQQVQNIVQNMVQGAFSNDKAEARHTFHHLPNTNVPQQQHPAAMSQEPGRFGADQMRAEPQGSRIVRMFSGSASQPLDYQLKETSPILGGGQIVGGRVIRADKPASTYDLVEQMHYLFVRVVKARDLPTKDVTGSLDPFVEVRVGNYKGITKHFEKNKNPEWNEVFAFAGDRMQSSVLEVVVKDKDMLKDDIVGFVRFDLSDVPTRVPPDSPLAPEWYRIANSKGEKNNGELMLAVWYGTQADEAFPDAWHSDAASHHDSSAAGSSYIRSKVYHSPRLWYVRVTIVEAQDLVTTEKTRFPDVYVKAQIGNQILKTKPTQARTLNPLWNEDLIFVVAEPFEDHLMLSVEDRVGPNKDETIGRTIIPLSALKNVLSKKDKKDKFASRLRLCLFLEGGYHVHDESTHYSSDLRPSLKQLWLRTPSIGVLELGILNADGLHPMKTRDQKGTSDTYCVAKYGQKWVRTRTIMNSLSPKYNEQYTWERPENWKVRIRISTLETGRVYTHTYPLLVLHPNGVKKMGELHLAIRFSCTSLMNTMLIYSRPLLPKMHYIKPFTVMQQDMLRHQAVNIVAARLSRSEPPLRKEVIEYMSDMDSHLWSMRRSKANFFRLMSVFSGLIAVGKWFGEVCTWKNPITTGLLDEEFDSFPTSRGSELVRMRYDRLRSVAGRIQTVVGDVATQGERFQALLSWRDPRATTIFLVFCLLVALVLYITPFQVLALVAGFYHMRHPRFRGRLPSAPINFFRRLPAKTDSML
ncbi:FT-interacting protein 1 [Vitis vinifera]|uniref:FT-interacting protein 1 n=1 Tax=Vitis vinifera TaxID=29760 RepID=A0A438D5A5_VITVI|nr:FT-interacting protein 1 [Vitis vinifera]